MAEQTLETLVLKLVADSDGLRGDMQKALSGVEKSTKEMQGALGGVGSAMNGLKAAAMSLAAAIGVTLSAGAFASMIAKSMEAIDAQAKLADRLDLTTDEYAALALAADLAGTSVEAVAQASNFLRKQIEAARAGQEGAVENFKQLGISAEKLAGMRIDQAIGMVSDKLYEMDDASKRTALALEIMGRGAMQLDAFMRDGSDGIAEAREQVESIGGAISRMDMAKVEQANDSWTSMQAIVTRVKDELAVQLSPAINMVLQEAIKFTTRFINDMGGVTKMVSTGLIAVLTYADGWVRTAQTIAGVMQNLINLMKVSWNAIGAAVNEVWAGIALAVDKTIFFMVRGLGQAIIDVGTDVKKLNEAAGQAIITMGKDVKGSVETMGISSKRTFEETQSKAVAAGEAVKAAWANIFTVDNSGSKAIQDMITGIQKSATEAKPDESKAPGGTANASNSPAVVKFREEQAAKLAELQKSLLGERELEVAAYMEKEAFLQGLKDEQFEITGGKMILAQELKAQHEKKLTDIEAKELESRKKMSQAQLKAQLDGASTFFSNMSSLMNTNSKRLFAIGKAAAIATTIVNTASAAMAAYNFGAQQGGPYLGAAYAAAAIAAGAVQLSNISSASPGGGGSSSGGGMGVPSTTGQDPNSPNVGARTAASAQDLNINVQGGGPISTEQLIEIASGLNRLRGQGIVVGNISVVGQ